MVNNLAYIVTTYSGDKTQSQDGADIAQLCDTAFILLSNVSLPANFIDHVMTIMDYVTNPSRLLSDMYNLNYESRRK